MNITEVLNWLNDFKHSWLSQNLLNDTRLIQLITNKLHELEQLLIRKYFYIQKKKQQQILFFYK
jgi:hypothetical protein